MYIYLPVGCPTLPVLGRAASRRRAATASERLGGLTGDTACRRPCEGWNAPSNERGARPPYCLQTATSMSDLSSLAWDYGDLAAHLGLLIRARYPLLYIVSAEEGPVEDVLEQVATTPCSLRARSAAGTWWPVGRIAARPKVRPSRRWSRCAPPRSCSKPPCRLRNSPSRDWRRSNWCAPAWGSPARASAASSPAPAPSAKK